jgi:hypothetical protein
MEAMVSSAAAWLPDEAATLDPASIIQSCPQIVSPSVWKWNYCHKYIGLSSLTRPSAQVRRRGQAKGHNWRRGGNETKASMDRGKGSYQI